MNKIVFMFLIVFSFSENLFSQEETDTTKLELNPQFRSIQLDASSIVFINKIGIALDVDIFNGTNKNKSFQSIGFRAGVDRFGLYTPGGPVNGSPFTHINAYLVRFTANFKVIRIDVYAGGAYQFVTNAVSNKKEKVYLKSGLDFKIKLFPYAGLLFNGALCSGESYVGLGLYLTYSE